ncbi:MAG: isocitrate/isopropylmalate family dehydrogenase, partial [Chloroflexi bacterium]|nr:isocitrate/isopropylmalate family dehydrogenase [Chloroflexota bacterium]
ALPILRQILDLYACLRPSKTYAGAPTPFKNVDLVVVRENTEDLYSGIEFERNTPGAAKIISLIRETTPHGNRISDDAGFSLKIATERAITRIVRFALEYARAHNRKKVSVIHKANIIRASDGLFLNLAKKVARDYPDIQLDDVIIDTLCMRLVRSPEQFDVMVLSNLYGDFISELCAGLVGGLGMAPSANIGDDIAVFEATHGSAPKYAGQNKVNPMSMMLSGVLMLRHLGEVEAADRLEKAIADVVAEGKNVTYDLRPASNAPVGTDKVADAVIEKLREVEVEPQKPGNTGQ